MPWRKSTKLSNRSITFLHGFLGSYKDWIDYALYFEKKGYAIFALDLPGHGKCDIWDLREFIHRIPKNTHLVGYSMGGRVALMLHKMFPSYFSSLTLISTNPGLNSQNEINARVLWEKEWMEQLKCLPIGLFIEKWYQQPLFDGFTPPSYRNKQNKENLLKAFSKFSIAKHVSLWDHLTQIREPVQMIFGVKDKKYMMIKEAISKTDQNQHIKLVSIQNCSHAVHLQAQHRVIKEIEKFVEFEKDVE